MAFLTNDPKILGFAFLGGLVPSLIWLWFWLKEEEAPEPKLLLTTVFILGMVAVVVVLPIQKFIQMQVSAYELQLLLWATVEELLKFIAVFIIIFHTKNENEPIDWPIYMITAALGFAALENTLFLIKPLSVVNGATVSLLTGQLRFLGSTLLHTVSSATIGIAMGISLQNGYFKKWWHFLVGFIVAVCLHTAFNFFIIRNNGSDFLKVFAFLWVVTIIIMLLFEKVRRMSEEITNPIN